MKYFINKWLSADDGSTEACYLDTSEGTYCYICKQDDVWAYEAIYQNKNGQWRDHEDETDHLLDAQKKIEELFLKNGYHSIPNRLCIML